MFSTKNSIHLTALGLLLGFMGCQGQVDVNEQVQPPATPTPEPTPPENGTLRVDPGRIDFGPHAPGCQAVETISITNIGLTPVSISGVGLSFGQETFLVDDWRGTLDYQASAEVMVAYRPTAQDTTHYGELIINSDAVNGNQGRAELLGAVYMGSEVVDSFEQSSADATDFLWVLDTSGSMNEDINRVISSFDNFMSGLANEGINYHMAFTTMDMKNDVGALIGTYGEEELPYITREMGTEAVTDMIAAMAARSDEKSDDSEKGLESIATALNQTNLEGPHAGFIRTDAQLVIVVLSDDNDYSPEKPDFYKQMLYDLKGSYEKVTFHSIVAVEDYEVSSEGNPSGCADGVGKDYLDMSLWFEGQVDSVCSGDYPGIMSTLGSYDKAILIDTFELSTTPLSIEQIVVTVDGEATTQGVEWTYEALQNAVVFHEAFLPPAEAPIRIYYTDPAACD